MPAASLQAQADAEIALAAGAQQADQLAASASAALTRADAAAPAGPVTGTTGVPKSTWAPAAPFPKAKPDGAAAADSRR